MARRRSHLGFLVLVALMATRAPVHAGEPRGRPKAPRSIAAALDALGGLLSPEALATLFATPEAELLEC